MARSRKHLDKSLKVSTATYEAWCAVSGRSDPIRPLACGRQGKASPAFSVYSHGFLVDREVAMRTLLRLLAFSAAASAAELSDRKFDRATPRPRMNGSPAP